MAVPDVSNLPVLTEPSATTDTLLLMNFESAIADESASVASTAVGITGTLRINRTSTRVGGACIDFPGDAFFKLPDSTAMAMDALDWTMESIFMVNKVGTFQVIASQMGDSITNGQFQNYISSAGKFGFEWVAGGARTAISNGTITPGLRYYGAVVKSGTALLGYLGEITDKDAVQVFSTTIASPIQNSTRQFSVGTSENSFPGIFDGKLFGFRYTTNTNRGMTGATVPVRTYFPVRG